MTKDPMTKELRMTNDERIGRKRSRRSTFRALCFVILSSLGLSSFVIPFAQAQDADLLPGELRITLGRELIGATRLPTLREIEKAVREPDVQPVAVFRLHGDRHNHYAPAWSEDGRSLVALRADIDARTCKIVLFADLHQPEPLTLYDDTASYEHMPSWNAGLASRLAFSSNRAGDQQEQIHLWEPSAVPLAVTTGPGSKVFPQLRMTGGQSHVLFRRVDQFELLPLTADRTGTPRGQGLGEADEMRFAPNGEKIAVIRSTSGEGSSQELLLRERMTPREVRLVAEPGRLLRSPRWSPDGRWLAFWSRAKEGRDWELWTVNVAQDQPAGRRATGVRVQEDFRHVGPAWSMDSQRVWFTAAQAEQSHYPLQWLSPDGSRRGQVEYARSLTTAIDVSSCPSSPSPALSFSAVERRSLELFVMLLNHP